MPTDSVNQRPLRLGTRGSALALAQSGQVAAALTAQTGRAVELVTVRTDGDVLTGSLASLGGTGVFAARLRAEVLAGTVDLAVHSYKDLPTADAPGLTVVASPPREDARDALCARDGLTLATLPAGARVGTGSPRRAAHLRAARPDLEVVDLRGNVDTRLRAVSSGALDAVVLAHAGLLRVGLAQHVTEVLDEETMLPAASQGALALEVATGRLDELAPVLAALDHRPTRLAVTAERTVLATLEAGCAAPVGVHAYIEDETLHVGARVLRVDGSDAIALSGSVPLLGERDHDLDSATMLGEALGEALLEHGAADLGGLTG